MEETTVLQQEKKGDMSPLPTHQILEKSMATPLVQHHATKKGLSRHQSITRGTTSSLAKAVRPNMITTLPEIQQRKISARTRKQSLTHMDVNRLLVTGSAGNNNHSVLTKRRSSWSPPQTDRKTPSPSQLSPDSLTIEKPPTPPEEVVPTHMLKKKTSRAPLLLKSSSTTSTSSSISSQKKHSHAIKSARPAQPEVTSHHDASHAGSVEKNQQTVEQMPLETPPPEDDDDESTQCQGQEHHAHQEDQDLPNYMRRPICAACTRNVKVSSSESSSKMKCSISSRRSSLSAQAAAAAINNNSTTTNQMIKRKPTAEEIKLSISNCSSTCSIKSQHQDRPHSPTSPIPTRHVVVTEKKRSILNQVATEEEEEEEEENEELENDTMSLDTSHHASSSTNTKWNVLLTQQQKLLEFINKDPNTMMTFSAAFSNDTLDETVILETQVELLKKFHSILVLSSQLSSMPPPPPSPSQVSHTPPPPPPLPIRSWQTKAEYSVAKLKWSLCQWFGTLVGTGNIEEQDFDTLGYTKNVVISGICVTTEPGLLPKRLQKYHLHQQEQHVICYKYMIHLSREKRLSTFTKCSDWDQDHIHDRCSFSIRQEGQHTRHCSAQFGVLERRHHCRSCGHIFCQTHSSNRLPLFTSNGEERGEWSRVCDSCFYARIEPQFIARS